jgi:hypothetical protein
MLSGSWGSGSPVPFGQDFACMENMLKPPDCFHRGLVSFILCHVRVLPQTKIDPTKVLGYP